MISQRLKKIAVVVAMTGSFVVLLPVSLLIVDPFFTKPYNPRWPCGVLLVWPDHVEVRWIKNMSEVSPRPLGERYTFNVPRERQAWVESQVRSIRPPNPDASWAIRVKQPGPSRQQIQLEIWRDEFTGLIYEARPDEIVPLHTRHAGVGASLIIVQVNALLWGVIWPSLRLFRRFLTRPRRTSLHVAPSI